MNPNDDFLQFFPTPVSLARRAWAKFEDKHPTRILEPNAGDGALLDACPWFKDSRYHRHPCKVDCVEIDMSKHPALKAKNYNVVGLDFLQHLEGSCYSHLILNPPFHSGAKHVLKAWDIAFNAEIVAIVNAETLRNPCNRERERLAQLVATHGSVEYIANAFNGPDSERATDVEIALIHLKKVADSRSIIGDLLTELRAETRDGETLAGEFREMQAVALPTSAIENAVVAFQAAVVSMREAVLSTARSTYYGSLLGETMANVCAGTTGSKSELSLDWVQEETGKRFDELQDRAWTGILRSSNVTSRLSSQAQKRVESEFEQIKKLQFSVANIYGFLSGIVESQGEIQLQMCEDIFDAICRYHTENACFYKGWKSNDKHARGARRLRHTRFILPGHRTDSWNSSLSWDSRQLLADFDRVFSMLDGKLTPDESLVDVCNREFDALRGGARVSASYFDVRYWPGAGTIHFFPKNQDVMDRLNRLVGKKRGWLPPEGERVSEDFWLQFDRCEKFDKELRAEVGKSRRNHWEDPFWQVSRANDDDAIRAGNAIDTALETVLQRHGINTNFQLEAKPQQQEQLLLAA